MILFRFIQKEYLLKMTVDEWICGCSKSKSQSSPKIREISSHKWLFTVFLDVNKRACNKRNPRLRRRIFLTTSFCCWSVMSFVAAVISFSSGENFNSFSLLAVLWKQENYSHVNFSFEKWKNNKYYDMKYEPMVFLLRYIVQKREDPYALVDFPAKQRAMNKQFPKCWHRLCPILCATVW